MNVLPHPSTSPEVSQRMCEHIAGLIAGGVAPRWWIAHVQRWIPPVALAHRSDGQQPTRALLLERMTRVAEAAQFLAAAILDLPVREFLEMGPFGALDEARCLRVLADLIRRAQGVQACPNLVTADGKPRAGRAKAMPPGGVLAKQLCAAIVVETWTHVRRRKPGPRNEVACHAAQALWEAADGGSRTGWGKTRIAGWRPYFEAAGQPPMASLRQEVRRHLIEAERQACVLGG